jgi:hypothetical protein
VSHKSAERARRDESRAIHRAKLNGMKRLVHTSPADSGSPMNMYLLKYRSLLFEMDTEGKHQLNTARIFCMLMKETYSRKE